MRFEYRWRSCWRTRSEKWSGAKKWERPAQRVDSRNGTYLRRLITTMGAVDLEVPRAREGGSAGGAVIGRYKRRSAEIDGAMVSAYVHGASTRDIGQITEAPFYLRSDR